MSAGVAIVALAARTPVGLGAESTAAAVRAGISRIREHPFLLDADGEPLKCGCDPVMAPELAVSERILELARSAVQEMARKFAATRLANQKIPLLLAVPEPRPGLDPRIGRRLAQALDGEKLENGCRLETHLVGEGHAGAFLGLEQALAQISRGKEELFLVGGVDSYLDPDTLEWLDDEFRLARPARRGGLFPGEGAAIVALAGQGLGRHLEMRALSVVRNVASKREMRDENAPEGPLGEALTEVYTRIGAALARTERFDNFLCDVNDERSRTTDLALAILRTGALFRDTAYLTPVGSTGDVGAAAGPLNLILASRAWNRGYASGPSALVSGSSWGGLRSAALLGMAS